MGTTGATLTRGPVTSHLVALTVPMVWGVLAMMGFNLTDTWFVAQLGEDQLAAMSFTFPVVHLMISLGIGLMAGTSSVVARVIGANEPERAKRLTTDALLLATILAVIASGVGIATQEPLFRLLGAQDAVLPLIGSYMTIWFAGYGFILVPMVGFGALRAAGDSHAQSRILAGGSLLNLALDPLFIFGFAGLPGLGMEGAAVATVCARGATAVATFWVLHKKHGLLAPLNLSQASLVTSWRQTLHVGLPAAGTNMIVPAATSVVVAIVAGFGPSAVAGFGAATRIEQFSLVVFLAMSAIIGPFVGQNLGAGLMDRVAQAMRTSALFCLAVGAALALILALAAPQLMALFAEQDDVLNVGVAYLRFVPISAGSYGVVMIVLAALNGLGRPLPAVIISLLRMLVLYVPLAILGGSSGQIEGVFLGISAANLIAGAVAWMWFRRLTRSIAGAEKVKTLPAADGSPGSLRA